MLDCIFLSDVTLNTFFSIPAGTMCLISPIDSPIDDPRAKDRDQLAKHYKLRNEYNNSTLRVRTLSNRKSLSLKIA
jgi:hypothetical protein